ncbi:MAG: hypothetical protein ACK5YR_11535 [Pirellula sp.]|jgi:hypothetical protein
MQQQEAISRKKKQTTWANRLLPTPWLVFYCGPFLLGGIYLASLVLSHSTQFSILTSAMAIASLTTGALLWFRIRIGLGLYVAIAIGFIIYSIYRIAIDGYTNSRLFVSIGGLLMLYGYSSVAEEMKEKEGMTDETNEKLAQDWHDKKTSLMVDILGREHDMVMHAIIPYAIGGGLDLYYFPNGITGTAIATKELCELPGQGSANDVFDTYELVMFTRQTISLDDAKDESTPFGRIHKSINAILNCIAPYSAQATLNPHETCEFPTDMATVGGKCLIFDAYGFDGEHSEFGLLLIIEIHRSEMDYAREHGGEELLEKLKQAGHYPYSDMDRSAVV